MISLGEVADFVNGVAFKAEEWGDEGRPIIRIQNLNDQAKAFNRTNRKVSDRNLARNGDLLVSWAASLGVYEWRGEEACINQHIFKVLPNSNLVDHAYLKRALETSISSMESQMHGATMKHITRDKFLGIKILLPPMPEQRRIAEILDKADALRAKRREAIAKLDQLLQSVFLDMFGDPVTNPMGWPQKELQEICDPSDRLNYGVVQPGEEFADGAPLIRVGDIDGGKIDFSSIKKIDPEIESAYGRSRLRGNELLVSCVGSIGTIASVPDAAIGYNIARAITRVPLINRQDRPFVRECLRSAGLQRYFAETTRTVSQPTLNVSFVKSAPIICPPAPLISRFCEITKTVEGQVQARVLPR
jgi:type I restriction enzyme S subunit